MQSIRGLIKANGTLNLQAGHDLTMVGGALQNTGKGATALSAGNDIMLMAHERGSHVLQDPNAPFDPNNYTKCGTYDQTGGTIDVGGSLSLTAGRDIFAQGTRVNAGGGIDLRAGKFLDVLAVFDVDEMSHTKSVVNKGLLSY